MTAVVGSTKGEHRCNTTTAPTGPPCRGQGRKLAGFSVSRLLLKRQADGQVLLGWVQSPGAGKQQIPTNAPGRANSWDLPASWLQQMISVFISLHCNPISAPTLSTLFKSSLRSSMLPPSVPSHCRTFEAQKSVRVSVDWLLSKIAKDWRISLLLMEWFCHSRLIYVDGEEYVLIYHC